MLQGCVVTQAVLCGLTMHHTVANALYM